MELNNLYNIDCIEGMNKLYEEKGECVDFLLTDPPYNLSRENRFKTMGRAGIDFGEWDKDFNLTEWISPAVKLLKDGSNIIIFNSWENLSEIKGELEKCGCEVKSLIQWVKTNPIPRNRDRRYVSGTEFAIWAVKSKKKKWIFNRSKPYENGLFYYAVPTGKNRIHSTQKAKGLIDELIKIHSNEGQVVLDPFSGSGIISHEAYELKRIFIAFENDKEMYDKSKEIILKNI